MKKLFYFLLCALPFLSFTSCSDDDNDLPDVDFSLTVSGGKFVDNKIYAVAGTDLVIDGITVINNEEGKEAMIPYANYYWDFRPIGQSVVAPYGLKIYIPEDTELGEHILEISAPLYAVDKSPAFTVIDYTVVVVADEADIPDGGDNSSTDTPQVKSNDPNK